MERFQQKKEKAILKRVTQIDQVEEMVQKPKQKNDRTANKNRSG